MNSFKRLFISVKTQLDGIVDDFENHEAVAGVAIKDLEAWRSQTRLHQHRLRKMLDQFEANLADLATEAATWECRAVKIRDQDEQKALECVRRMLRAQQQSKLIAAQVQATQKQHAQLEADLSAIQNQLHNLNTQKAVFAARQNRIHLQANLSNRRENPLDEANKIFNRWEEAITGAEFDYPETCTSDTFAESFAQEENALELTLLLDELMTKSSQALDGAGKTNLSEEN
jgi:phage shock protein A